MFLGPEHDGEFGVVRYVGEGVDSVAVGEEDGVLGGDENGAEGFVAGEDCFVGEGDALFEVGSVLVGDWHCGDFLVGDVIWYVFEILPTLYLV